MINKAKLALTAMVVVACFASHALAHSFDEDGTRNVLAFSSRSSTSENASHHARVHAGRRNGLNSFATEPRAQSESNANASYPSRVPPFDYRGSSSYPWGLGYNFPYPDRPYGDPDHW
ncbi:MAG TPA: hypothetical protein VHT68_22460 [Pseudolabrys sp.]|jgi:hypothetical protein|nr:hypothetical protein [Pseudolabrys sp.]